MKLKSMLVAAAWIAMALPAVAGTAITYQGQLTENGQPFTGTVDMTFTLLVGPRSSDRIGNPVVEIDGVAVTDGLFQVELDFGNVPYEEGASLIISVDGDELSPGQPVTSAPLAARTIFAVDAQSAVDAGTAARALTGVRDFLTNPAVNEASGVASFVGGGIFNTASQEHSAVVGGESNEASGSNSVVVGGSQNAASGSLSFVAGGGGFNEAQGGGSAVIGGGPANKAIGINSFVAGGAVNQATGRDSVAMGGGGNIASGDSSFVAGRENQASGLESAVPGGGAECSQR